MSNQDRTEKVLRGLHVLLSKSEPYGKEPSKVIVDKQEMLDLLSELNKCIYDIMDDYELTKQSRDRAEREFRKKGDEIVWDASRKAEDIYAASVMYTDEALSSVNDVISKAGASISEIYAQMNRQLEEQQKVIHRNQLELKSQLQDLVDTEKYLKLIEERNRERQKEKKNPQEALEETNLYANRQTEIKINREYFEQAGIPLEDEPKEAKESTQPEIKVDLDAEYFQWKEEENKEGNKKKNSDGKKDVSTGEFYQRLKNFTGKKNGRG
ncbi:MAG: hypothetical protein MR356_04030 [Agathobacter sp.]|nr:hypothetical protein [Agathobacter sp.]